MLIEVTQPIRFRLRTGEEVHLRPGVPTDVPDVAAKQLLQKAAGKVKTVAADSQTGTQAPDQKASSYVKQNPRILPVAPLRPGWLVVYRDRSGCLRGGPDERDAGIVLTCGWDGQGWHIALRNGEFIPLRSVTAVAKVNPAGRILAAWTVREQGYDGEGKERAHE